MITFKPPSMKLAFYRNLHTPSLQASVHIGTPVQRVAWSLPSGLLAGYVNSEHVFVSRKTSYAAGGLRAEFDHHIGPSIIIHTFDLMMSRDRALQAWEWVRVQCEARGHTSLRQARMLDGKWLDTQLLLVSQALQLQMETERTKTWPELTTDRLGAGGWAPVEPARPDWKSLERALNDLRAEPKLGARALMGPLLSDLRVHQLIQEHDLNLDYLHSSDDSPSSPLLQAITEQDNEAWDHSPWPWEQGLNVMIHNTEHENRASARNRLRSALFMRGQHTQRQTLQARTESGLTGLRAELHRTGTQAEADLLDGTDLFDRSLPRAQIVAGRQLEHVINLWSELSRTSAELRPLMSMIVPDAHHGRVHDSAVRLVALELPAAPEDPYRIIMHPVAIQELSSLQIKRQMLRMVLTVGLGYPWRGLGRHPRRWHVACQLALRLRLDEVMGSGSRAPEEDDWRHLEHLASPEAIYDLLPENVANPMNPKGLDFWFHTEKHQQPENVITSEHEETILDALREGLASLDTESSGRLGGDLRRELQLRAEPPPNWEVELAGQLGDWHRSRERTRSFARPSRRNRDPYQPRAGWLYPREGGGEIAVVLDVSGSMQDNHLERLLGSVSSLCRARDITRLRVITIDARPHDLGWMPPSGLNRITATGGGGTSLGAALEILQDDPEVPADMPALICTDGGFLDQLIPERPHAFLLTPRSRLLFRTKAPVFRMR